MIHHTSGSSPVVFADAKLCGDETARFWTDVQFKSVQDLEDLISALVSLRDHEEFDHVHLQDNGLSPQSRLTSAEVVFHKPQKKDGSRMATVEKTEALLRAFQSQSKKTEQGAAANP